MQNFLIVVLILIIVVGLISILVSHLEKPKDPDSDLSNIFPYGWEVRFHPTDSQHTRGEWYYYARNQKGGVLSYVAEAQLLKVQIPEEALNFFGIIALAPNVRVLPFHHNRGLGEQVLREAIAQARSFLPKGTKLIWMQVADENKHYAWSGFRADFPIYTFELSGPLTKIDQLNFPEGKIYWFEL